MILKKVQYSQFKGKDHAWDLVDFCPQQINLVVGKNATGKTKTLINRIANLINKGVDPNKIVALAFNKRAADEMIQRLTEKQIFTAKKISEEGVIVRTFHSFGYEIIKTEIGWNFNGLTEKRDTRKWHENLKRG